MSDNHHPQVLLPRDQTNSAAAAKDDEQYQLTVDHALRYQKLLANRSGSNLANGPLMTKRLRENEKPQSKNPLQGLDYLYIRARLPDRTALDYQLSVSSTLHSLYEIVKGSLQEEASTHLVLSLSSPYTKLKDDDSITLIDAGFHKKTLVIAELPNVLPPYLKPHLLANAKSIEQASSTETGSEAKDNETAPSQEEKKPAKKLTKAPKWLKISKK
ncbi:hypothetical protein C6P41_002498 [Kluyveromyces marxianus]|nr:hypothetical protein C6P43_003189 [Kluyveromyces marxianus]KAG0684221.1 hypothetical protein C6P41_002498 [Kluyveromyces marxianus]